jgi:MFS family permease
MCVATAFIWYLLAFITLSNLANNIGTNGTENIIIFGVNAGAIALSGLLGSFIIDKFKKRRLFLYLWIISGIALSILPLAFNVANINELLIISLIFGLYFGFGMPATMGYHSSFTSIEGRAKIGGLTFLVIGVSSAAISFIPFDSLILPCLILAFVRLIGLGFFHFMPITQEPNKETSKVKYIGLIQNRSFLFYFIPWLMFTLINFTTIPTQNNIPDIKNNPDLFNVLENIVIAIVAVIGGFVADRWGRKRLTIIGFIVLGIGYAVLGLYPGLFGSVIYTIVDGVAWGIFYVIFVFTLWGDLAQNRNSDKIYFLGVLPFVSSYFIELIFSPILVDILPSTIFSFASVFLFLAVLPLIYAPETLPEKLMKDRDLKSYIENAKKKAQKESDNVHKKEKPNANNNDDEKPSKSEEDKEYQDAVKLAEKYY